MISLIHSNKSLKSHVFRALVHFLLFVAIDVHSKNSTSLSFPIALQHSSTMKKSKKTASTHLEFGLNEGRIDLAKEG